MAQPAKMAKITIDAIEYEFEEGTNLFEAVERATGEKLPHFCYHPGLSIAGVCRMCQVEVEGSPKLMIACNTTVRDGMVVRTKTPRVQETVRNILNFHLLHHPVDCPVCDQAGECSLQDFYMDHGLYEAEIDHQDKLAKGKVKPIGDHVMLDAERCVLCARCTRFTSEVTKTYELGIFNRGNHSEIDVAPGRTLDNNYSLNTVDICPVGALTSRDFRFRRRVWWLSETDSICPGCATGCNMHIHHSEGVPYRFKPRENSAVNEYWMCDHGRLLYHQINAEDRLRQPMRLEDGRQRPVSWEQAYGLISAKLTPNDERAPLLIVGSPHLSVEELYGLRGLAQASGGELVGARLAGTEMGEDDGILLAADRTPNAEGARRLGLEEFSLQDLDARLRAQTVLLIFENDLVGLDSAAGPLLDRCAELICISSRENATTRMAGIVLPASTFAEKDGIFVNRHGRAQRFEKAFDAPGAAQDPIDIVRRIARLLGTEFGWRTVEELRSELSAREESFGALAGGIDAPGISLDVGVREDAEVGRD